MTKKESQNGSTMGINHYTINEKVSKTRVICAAVAASMFVFMQRIEEKPDIPGNNDQNGGKLAAV